MPNQPDPDLIDAAADRLQFGTRVVCSWGDGEATFCLASALAAARGLTPLSILWQSDDIPEVAAVSEFLTYRYETLPEGWARPLVYYNDVVLPPGEEGTAQVVEDLRLCAKELREAQQS